MQLIASGNTVRQPVRLRFLAAQCDHSVDVTRQARSAERHAGLQILMADPRIRPDGLENPPDVLATQCLREPAHHVGELNLHAQVEVQSDLGEFRLLFGVQCWL